MNTGKMCCMVVDITKGIVMAFEAEQVNHSLL